MNRVKINKKVSMVILLINNFTNEIIQDNGVRIQMISCNSHDKFDGVSKDDGHRVFLNLKSDIYHIVIEGHYYQKKILQVPLELEKLDSYQFIKIRLNPNKMYDNPSVKACIQGCTNVRGKIKIAFLNAKCRLLEDYDQNMEEGKIISIYYPKYDYLDNMLFYIQDENNGSREEFIICEQLEKGQKNFLLQNKLEKDYKKSTSMIGRVYEIDIDENGEFYFLISEKDFLGETIMCEILLENHQVIQKEIMLGNNRLEINI